MKSTLKIALTGGIASGKSTCAKIFAKLGATVHEADEIAKELLSSDSAIAQSCISHFGKVIISEGKLDRAKLRKHIFANSQARTWLNAKMHPEIRNIMFARSNCTTALYHLLVIPLLFESSHNYQPDKIISVVSEHQLKRAIERDKVAPFDIQKIMQVQVSDAVRIAQSDFIIFNNGEDLTAQVMKIHAQISSG